MPAEQEPNVISDLIDANNDLAVSAVQAISQLQAELLAAQEQLAVLNKHSGLAAEERDALQGELLAAQERVKQTDADCVDYIDRMENQRAANAKLQRKYSNVKAQFLAAQEREKALLAVVEAAKDYFYLTPGAGKIRERVTDALAALYTPDSAESKDAEGAKP